MRDANKDKYYPIDTDLEKIIKSQAVNKVGTHRVEYKESRQFDVYEIDIQQGSKFLLQLRTDNGRLSPDVLAYRSKNDNQDPDQEWLLDRLVKKDVRIMNDLISDLKRFGQRVPVIITADGKLVDGNRRRSAFHQISLDNITHARNFKRMRVCILPGSNDPDRPSYADIRRLETRIQAQTEGKSEWKDLDWAITRWQNKEQDGISYREQIMDLPEYETTSNKEKFIVVKEKEWMRGLIKPVESFIVI